MAAFSIGWNSRLCITNHTILGLISARLGDATLGISSAISIVIAVSGRLSDTLRTIIDAGLGADNAYFRGFTSIFDASVLSFF